MMRLRKISDEDRAIIRLEAFDNVLEKHTLEQLFNMFFRKMGRYKTCEIFGSPSDESDVHTT